MIDLSRWMKVATLVTLAPLLFPLAARSADGLVALTPKPNEHIAQSPKVVTVEVAGRTSVERSAVHLVVDGRDVSDAISTTHNLVQYKPSQPLSAGEHAVEIAVSDAAGGRLSYTFTFTVEGGGETQSALRSSSSSAGAGAAPQASPAAGDDSGASAAPPDDSSAYEGATPQTINGQQNFYGGFYPIGGGPYYWGDNAQFEFLGLPGGFGFVTFSGIPGVFDLLPLGLNSFYAIVPIPIGFIFGPLPIVTCHFFTPSGGTAIVTLPSFPVVHHRRVVTEPVARTTFGEHSTTTRSGLNGNAQHHQSNVKYAVTGSHSTFAAPTHIVTARPLWDHPIHVEAAPHFVTAPSPVQVHFTPTTITTHTTTTH